MADEFAPLETFLRPVPGIEDSIGKARFENGNWWAAFSIEIDHPRPLGR